MPKQPDMGALLRQAQQMQAELEKAQAELASEEVEASAGGGAVTVKITGALELKELTIRADVVDPEDIEFLQDAVLAAVNEAIRSAQELANRKLGQAAGGLGGLGGLGL